LGSQLIPYEQIVQPAKFRAAIAVWRQQRQLWIDTEVADWSTPNPRLSLLQVRTAAGPNVVVDVLEGVMRQILYEEFIPQIMESDQVEKWAHYARYERRFLGQDRVANLNCTFEMARSLSYYRLPLRSLSLAALVKHFFSRELDKTLQKADWGIRPLSHAHIEYAASDTEWCYGVYHNLRAIPRAPDPAEDDPALIRARYIELLAPLKKAQIVRTGIRDVVKEFMTESGVHRLSRFLLDTRTTYSTDLGTLIEFALARDPGARFDLAINLSAQQRSELGSDVEERIKPFAEIRNSQTFHSPHAPRLRDEPPYLYDLHPEDDERLTCEYETAEDKVSILDSERVELRDRMKGWLRFQELEHWEGFRFSTPRERWKVDVRALQGLVMANEPIQIPFPQRLRLAFGDSEIEALIAAGRSKQSAVLRWLSRASSVGVDAQLSRDWHEPEPD
jgi:ribonuclease D